MAGQERLAVQQASVLEVSERRCGSQEQQRRQPAGKADSASSSAPAELDHSQQPAAGEARASAARARLQAAPTTWWSLTMSAMGSAPSTVTPAMYMLREGSAPAGQGQPGWLVGAGAAARLHILQRRLQVKAAGQGWAKAVLRAASTPMAAGPQLAARPRPAGAPRRAPGGMMVPATEDRISARMLRNATMEPRLMAALDSSTTWRPTLPSACSAMSSYVCLWWWWWWWWAGGRAGLEWLPAGAAGAQEERSGLGPMLTCSCLGHRQRPGPAVHWVPSARATPRQHPTRPSPRRPPAAQLAAPQQDLVGEPAGQQAAQHHHSGQHPAAGLEAEGAAQDAGPQDA